MKPEILITGATGKTGGHATRQLLDQGISVRILIRKEKPVTKELADMGAEVVMGDMLDIVSLEKAFEGIKKVYFTFPFTPGLLEAASNMAVIAKDAGVELFVNMSQIIAAKGHNSPSTRQHWLSENLFDWANIGAVHLRPGLFLDNLLVVAAHSVATEGKMYLPWGDGKHAGIHSGDIAKIITKILTDTDPSEHIGKKYVITGEKSRTMAEVASTISSIIGKDVEYVNIPDETWLEGIKQLPPMLNNAQFLGHATPLSVDVRNQKFDVSSTIVKDMTGDEPVSLEQFVTQTKAFFLDPSQSENLLKSFY